MNFINFVFAHNFLKSLSTLKDLSKFHIFKTLPLNVSFEKKINQEGIETNSEEIKSFVNFLQLNNLIVQPRGQSTNLLLQQKNSQKKNWLYFLIHSYLFFKVPVIKPDEWLGRTLKYVRALGSKKYRNIIYILGFVGICLVIQQFETFLNTFMYFFSFKGLMLYLVTLIFVKSLQI